MAVLQQQIPFYEFSPGPLPPPEDVRGLSLDAVGIQHGAPGLLVRLDDTLQEHDLYTPEVIEAANLALRLHPDDWRTYMHTYGHLAEVALYIVERLELDQDPDLVVAALLHDGVEDHASEVVAELSGKRITDEAEARAIGFALLSERIGSRPVRFMEGVTNPILRPGQDKRVEYMHKTSGIIKHQDPEVPVLKLGDFISNAVKNDLTRGPRQREYDVKYLPAYGLHIAGLYRSDSLVTRPIRIEVVQELSDGLKRAQHRL